MKPTENRFFKKAMERASHFLKNRQRMSGLLQSAGSKLKDIDMGKVNVSQFRDRIMVMVRMARAYINGSYRDVPWKSIVAVTAALIYFVTPLDLVPDFIPISGFLDDFTVVLWVYNSIKHQLDDFVVWETEIKGELRSLD